MTKLDMFQIYRKFGYPEKSIDFENDVNEVIKDELEKRTQGELLRRISPTYKIINIIPI